jgi:predicted dehydrogenase
MLTIGILGAAGIAPAAVIHPAHRRDDVIIGAVASRSAESARAYAEVHGIPRWYGSYEELLADPSIDLVYVALPPSGHARWTIAALEAGKDVLCEKPIAMNATEAAALVAAAERTGRRLIEAFHDRYHPLSRHIDEVVASGRLGAIRSLRADFLVSIPFDPASIRHVPELGGGALMDLGCYPLHWVRTVTGEEPTVVSATGTANPLGVDMTIEAHLLFPSGITAIVTASMAAETNTVSLLIEAESGTLKVENPVFPSGGHTIIETVDGVDRISTVAGLVTYDHQLEAVVRALATGQPTPTEGADIIGNATAIDAIYAAAGFPAR